MLNSLAKMPNDFYDIRFHFITLLCETSYLFMLEMEIHVYWVCFDTAGSN